MKFTQIIEFSTTRIDELNATLDTWITSTEGNRIPHRAVLRRDREAEDRYRLFAVEGVAGSGASLAG